MNGEIIIALLIAGLWTWRRVYRIRKAKREEQFVRRLTEVM